MQSHGVTCAWFRPRGYHDFLQVLEIYRGFPLKNGLSSRCGVALALFMRDKVHDRQLLPWKMHKVIWTLLRPVPTYICGGNGRHIGDEKSPGIKSKCVGLLIRRQPCMSATCITYTCNTFMVKAYEYKK